MTHWKFVNSLKENGKFSLVLNKKKKNSCHFVSIGRFNSGVLIKKRKRVQSKLLIELVFCNYIVIVQKGKTAFVISPASAFYLLLSAVSFRTTNITEVERSICNPINALFLTLHFYKRITSKIEISIFLFSQICFRYTMYKTTTT